MKPYYEDDAITLYHCDYREGLQILGPGFRAEAVITDPPYGETNLEWDRWPDGWLTDAASIADALWCFGSFRMFHEHAAEFAASWKFSQDVIWEKHNGSGFTADRFKRVHELATFWYQGEWADLRHETPRVTSATSAVKSVRRRGATPHTGEIGDTGYVDDGTRLMRSVLQVRSEHGRAIHPTQKPLGILTPLIEYSVAPGGVLVDLFSGSGSVALAARLTGRRCVAFEADESYAEAAAERLSQQELAGWSA